MQKSVASIFYNDNQLEHVMGKQMTFTTATKKIKHLEYDTHTHTYTQLLRDSQDVSSSWKDISHLG